MACTACGHHSSTTGYAESAATTAADIHENAADHIRAAGQISSAERHGVCRHATLGMIQRRWTVLISSGIEPPHVHEPDLLRASLPSDVYNAQFRYCRDGGHGGDGQMCTPSSFANFAYSAHTDAMRYQLVLFQAVNKTWTSILCPNQISVRIECVPARYGSNDMPRWASPGRCAKAAHRPQGRVPGII